MSVFDDLIVRVKRGDSAATRALRDIYKGMLRVNLPDTPASRRVYGAIYRAHDMVQDLRELAFGKFLYEPMARARFHQVGKNVQLTSLPYVRGHTRVIIGDNFRGGYFSVRSGKYHDEPTLEIGDNCVVATGVVFLVNERVTVGDNVGMAGRVRIADSTGHPSQLDRRQAGEDMTVDDIEPVTIESYAWIGHSAHIQKGVTIGEGAIVAPGSVVVKDVPAGGLAMGIPARNLAKPW